MRWLIRKAVENPVLINIIFWLVVVAGAWTALTMPKEEFPQVGVDQVYVYVAYASGALEEGEESVIRPIEAAVEDIEGIKHIYSEAREDDVLVRLEFISGTDVDQAAADIERTVVALDTLPDDAATPMVGVVRLRVPITHLGLTGDITAVDLADELAEELGGFAGVKDVHYSGAATFQIIAELDPAEVAVRGLDPGQVAAAIEAASKGIPAGQLLHGESRVVVQTTASLNSVEEIANVPLVVRGGSTLKVGDVARVYEHWAPPPVRRYVNGTPAIVLTMERTDTADAVGIVKTVEEWLPDVQLPSGMSIVSFDDSARMVRHRIEVLFKNGLAGLVLVAGFMVLFIGRRNSMLVLWGMPVALLGAFLLMGLVGVTVSVISTFALLLVTGIIVDDAVVVVENVQRHLEMGKSRVDAAIDGTLEVWGAVFVATLTTCLAFAPMMMLDGAVGQVMAIVPIVVIMSLFASLVEALIVLPAHLAHHAKESDAGQENRATRVIKQIYRPVLAAVTGRFRYLTLAGSLLLVLLAGVVGSGMRLTLTTAGKPVYIEVNLDLPPSANAEKTRSAIKRVEQFLQTEAPDLILYVDAKLGQQVAQQGISRKGTRFGQLKIGFINTESTLEKVPAFIDELKAMLSKDPELTDFAILTAEGGPPSGKAIDVKVRSKSPEQAETVARLLTEHLAATPGVKDLRSGIEPGVERFRVVVDEVKAARFGLNQALVARSLRAAIHGITATKVTVKERQTDVLVKLGGGEHRDLEAVRDLPLVLPNGGVTRLRQVTDVYRTRGSQTLERVDGVRTVPIIADVDEAITTPEEAAERLDQVFEALKVDYPDVSLFYGGAIADSAESFSKMPMAASIALMLIFGVLSVQFRSYLQPLIIMAAVPLGLVGVVFGLSVLGMDLSLIAAIGTVGLIGIVVNDTLVLIDFANSARKRGLAAKQAIIEAAMTRLRPILITTITTVLGLAPLGLGLAGEEPLLAPMAAAISFGLVFATVLSLLVIPPLYLMIEDVRAVWASLVRRVLSR